MKLSETSRQQGNPRGQKCRDWRCWHDKGAGVAQGMPTHPTFAPSGERLRRPREGKRERLAARNTDAAKCADVPLLYNVCEKSELRRRSELRGNYISYID